MIKTSDDRVCQVLLRPAAKATAGKRASRGGCRCSHNLGAAVDLQVADANSPNKAGKYFDPQLSELIYIVTCHTA